MPPIIGAPGVIMQDTDQVASYDYVGPRVNQIVFDTDHNDLTHTAEYDGVGRAQTLAWNTSSSSLAQYEYRYDKHSNILSSSDVNQSGNTSESFEYDSLNRLTRAVYDHRSLTHNYHYDDLGNRMTFSNNGDDTYVLYSDANELTSWDADGPAQSVEYDAHGNLTRDERDYLYFYDRQNQITEIRDSGNNSVAEYSYDALGRRIEMTNVSASETTRFYYDNSRVIEETDDMASPSLKRHNIWGPNYIDELLLTHDYSADDDYILVRNHQFSVMAAVKRSDGSVAERYDYDAHGTPRILNPDYSIDSDGVSDIGNTYLYAGRRIDFLDGGSLVIQYNRARYHSSRHGRWLQRDPLGYVDGANLYEYVGSRFTIALDPLGTHTTLSCDEISRDFGLNLPGVRLPAGFITFAAGLNAGINVSGERCERCCDNGDEITDVSFGVEVHGSGFLRVTGGLDTKVPFGVGELSVVAGISLTREFGVSGSASGYTDRCEGIDDPTARLCISMNPSARLSVGVKATLEVSWWFSYTVGAEVFGEVHATVQACWDCTSDGCTFQSSDVTDVGGSVGVKFCWGGCYSHTFFEF